MSDFGFEFYNSRKNPLAVVFNRSFLVGTHWARDTLRERDVLVWCPASLPEDHPQRRSFCILCASATHENHMRVNWRHLVPVRPFTGTTLAEGFSWWLAPNMAMEQLASLVSPKAWRKLHIYREGYGLTSRIIVRPMLLPVRIGRQPKAPDAPPELEILSNEAMTRRFLTDPETLDKPTWAVPGGRGSRMSKMYLRIVTDAGKHAEPKRTVLNGETVLVYEVVNNAFFLHQGLDKNKPLLLDVRAVPDADWMVVTLEDDARA